MKNKHLVFRNEEQQPLDAVNETVTDQNEAASPDVVATEEVATTEG